MRTVGLNRFPYCCTTAVVPAALGTLIREQLLTVKLPKDSPLNVVKAAMCMPVGRGFFEALRQGEPVRDKVFCEFLRLKSARKRHVENPYEILIPDFLKDVSRSSIRSFYEATDDHLMLALCDAVDADFLTTRTDWNHVLKFLDAASLGLGIPASLISYLNFVNDASVPSDNILRKKSAAIRPSRDFPSFNRIVTRILTSGLSGGLSNDIRKEGLSLCSSSSPEEATLIEAALYYSFEFTVQRKTFAGFKAECAPGTDRTYLYSLPRALHLLTTGELQGKHDGNIRIGVMLIRQVRGLKNEHPEATRLLDEGRDYCLGNGILLSPSELDAAYQMPTILPSAEAIRSNSIEDPTVARLIVKILLRNCFARFDALAACTLGDFKISKRLLEWRLTDSKGRFLDLSFPVSNYTPEAEVTFLRAAIPHLKDRFGDTASLLSLAGIDADPIFKNAAHQNWINATQGSQGTHIARGTGLSWLPIRVLCAQNPELLSHPALSAVRNTAWFQPEELRKLLVDFPCAETDVVEVIRLLVGWADKRQFFSNYFKASHIALLLHMDLQGRLVAP